MVSYNWLSNLGHSRFVIRLYSQYPRYYVEPIYEKKKLDRIVENDQLKDYKHVIFKAAKTTETYSELHDVVLAKFVNYIMIKGNKLTARNEMNKTLTRIKTIQVSLYNQTTDEEEKKKIILDPVRIVKQAIQNCRPLLKLTPVRRGGSTYQVPCPISDRQSLFFAMRRMVLAAREKDIDTPFHVTLTQEILDAAGNKGRVVKQKIELHKTCEANRAYAHYRWG